MRFHVADTLTGRVVGRLEPISWSLEDPLRSPGPGTLTIAKPTTATKREQLLELTRPRTRFIAAEDDQGRFVWAGPVPRRPQLSDSTMSLKVADWRSWFYRAFLRPNAAGARQDYMCKDREQATIYAQVAARALATTWPSGSQLMPPRFIIDALAPTGVTRDREWRMLDTSIGDCLDTLMKAERGIEWWTYATWNTADQTVIDMHVTAAYPERSLRSTPVLLEWRQGRGGNLAERPTWPETHDAPTRVWATGDGQPPKQAWSVDEDTAGGVVWEEKLGPLSGVKRSKTAFEHAYSRLSMAKGYASTAEFVIAADRLPLGDVGTGDRARIVYDDGWDSIDLSAARIVSRVMSGGKDAPTVQRLVVDLADTFQSTAVGLPGEPGVEES